MHIPWLAGVPNEVVQRTDSVLQDLHTKKPLRCMISEKLAARDRQYQVHDLPHNDIFNEKKNIYAVLVDLGGTKSTNTLPCILCSYLCPYLHRNM